MDITHIRADFARRMNEVCDALDIPAGHGRQTALGKMFGVTPKGARKWLLGLAYPEMPLAVAICDKAGVNVLWLLQGTPPKRGTQVDPQALALAEGLQALPGEQRNAVLDFMRYQFERTGQWFAGETLRHYLADIDALKRQSTSDSPPRKQANSGE